MQYIHILSLQVLCFGWGRVLAVMGSVRLEETSKIIRSISQPLHAQQECRSV